MFPLWILLFPGNCPSSEEMDAVSSYRLVYEKTLWKKGDLLSGILLDTFLFEPTTLKLITCQLPVKCIHFFFKAALHLVVCGHFVTSQSWLELGVFSSCHIICLCGQVKLHRKFFTTLKNIILKKHFHSATTAQISRSALHGIFNDRGVSRKV